MKDEILSLRARGFSYSEIRGILGCSLSTISYYCGNNQTEKAKKRAKATREKKRLWFDSIKSQLSCNRCGESRTYLLDFHHKDPRTKEGSVSKLISSASKKRILDEIGKCEVLCSNCHREHHHFERLNKKRHGKTNAKFKN